MFKKIGFAALFFFLFLFITPSAHAVSFTLVPPSGQLSRGQEVTFTINIDTEGATITTIQTGMTFVTTALEYVSSAPGAAMNNVTVDTSLGADKLLFTGTNAAGYTGADAFATVVFKIVATESGSTELCTLWQPEVPTPTTNPTTGPQCNAACTSNTNCPSNLYCYIASGSTSGYCRMQTCSEQTSCTCPLPTSPPQPTALPQTGGEAPKNMGILAGVVFIVLALGIVWYTKKNSYSLGQQPHKKHPRSS